MPIKELTDETREQRIGGYVQIGNIRKGEPKTDPKKPGRELPHFRIVPLPGEEAAAARIFEVYGTDRPAELRVLLPYDRLEAFWDTWREAYAAGGMIHRCDGVTVVRAADPAEEGQPCRRRHLPKQKGGCFPVGRLYVIVPELNRLAVWCVHTTSLHDLINISAELRQLWRDVETLFGYGFYRGVPVLLRRTPRLISTPSADSASGRARRRKYLIHLEIDPAWVAEAQRVLQQRALPGAERPALPAGVAGALPARAGEVIGAEDPHEPPAGWTRASFDPGELAEDDDFEVADGELIEDDGGEDLEDAPAEAGAHWSTQASTRHAGKTNWQAILTAAAKRWTYTESDVLRFARARYGAADAEGVPVDMAAFWTALEAWNPAAEATPAAPEPPADPGDEIPF